MMVQQERLALLDLVLRVLLGLEFKGVQEQLVLAHKEAQGPRELPG
jgi:hypothetical protein